MISRDGGVEGGDRRQPRREVGSAQPIIQGAQVDLGFAEDASQWSARALAIALSEVTMLPSMSSAAASDTVAPGHKRERRNSRAALRLLVTSLMLFSRKTGRCAFGVMASLLVQKAEKRGGVRNVPVAGAGL